VLETDTPTQETPLDWHRELDDIINNVVLEDSQRPWAEKMDPVALKIEQKRRLNAKFSELMSQLAEKPDDTEINAQLEYLGTLLQRYEDVDETTHPASSPELAQARGDLQLAEQSRIAQNMIKEFRDKNDPKPPSD
jgi:hypothetical protein